VRWTYDDSEGVKMHHMLCAGETEPKRHLSFECCDSKNNILLCLGKTNMGVTCGIMTCAWVDREQFQDSFFNPAPGTKAPLVVAPNSAGLHPVIRHIPKKCVQSRTPLQCFTFHLLSSAMHAIPGLFCCSRSLSLNNRDFVFHLRAFCIRRSAVFGVRGHVLDTCECNLHLTHRLLQLDTLAFQACKAAHKGESDRRS
jgi:hypothetical protein